jgi:hypothetical protein
MGRQGNKPHTTKRSDIMNKEQLIVIDALHMAIMNKPMDLVKGTYGDHHVGGYLEEKCNAVCRDGFVWWGSLDYSSRRAAIKTALDLYGDMVERRIDS